jgi:hypothetical protein
MKISELLSEQQLTIQQQIARDTELMTRHMLKQRQQQQSQQAPQQSAPAPVATPKAAAPTPDQIAKHPQYNAVYQKTLKQVQAQGTSLNPKADADSAKKFTDQRIARMIQAGQ